MNGVNSIENQKEIDTKSFKICQMTVWPILGPVISGAKCDRNVIVLLKEGVNKIELSHKYRFNGTRKCQK